MSQDHHVAAAKVGSVLEQGQRLSSLPPQSRDLSLTKAKGRQFGSRAASAEELTHQASGVDVVLCQWDSKTQHVVQHRRVPSGQEARE